MPKEAVPTKDELENHQATFQKAEALRARSSPAPGPFPSAEEMQRQDRGR